jgi:hypothetical protein
VTRLGRKQLLGGNGGETTTPAPAALTNTVQPLHEMPRHEVPAPRRRGRPRNPNVDLIAAVFPDARSRRSQWHRLAYVRAADVLIESGLADQAAIERGAALPLPDVVLYALGEIEAPPVVAPLARRCLALRAEGWRAHALASWVRQQRGRLAYWIACREAGTATAAFTRQLVADSVLSPELAAVSAAADAGR